jgi:hypothetical protein
VWSREKRTLVLDASRGALEGVTSSLLRTINLLIAIKYYGVSDAAKSLIAAASFIGNLLSLFYTAGFSRSRLKKATLVAAPTFIAGVGFILASATRTGWVFVSLVSFAAAMHIMRLPFLTAIYEENYRSSRRGKLYSVGLLLSVAVAIGSNSLFGGLLERSLESFRAIYTVAGALIAASSVLIVAIPSHPPRALQDRNPFRNLAAVRENPVFGYMLFVWFLFGFAVLWSNPLRLVYLAEAERGLNLSPFAVLLIMGIIPSVARLLTTWFWAHLFDRIDFVLLRLQRLRSICRSIPFSAA